MSAERYPDSTSKHAHSSGSNGAMSDNPLSEREMEVAKLLATGASNTEIAHSLIISPHTVKVHLRNIFEKLEVNSRTEASMRLVQRGWLTVPGVEVPVPPSQPSESTPPAPSLPPDPEPLVSVAPHLRGWQRFYLLVAAMFAFVALLVPLWQGRASAAVDLLSDQNQLGGRAAEVQSLPRWQAHVALPEARSRLALVYLDEQLYAIGGEGEGGKLYDEVARVDLRTNDWHRAPSLPNPISNIDAVVISDTIYVAGGSLAREGQATREIGKELLAWTITQDAWRKVTDLPYPLTGASLVADEDSLYLIGGWDGAAMRDEVWRLANLSQPNARLTWQLVTRLEQARAFAGAVVVAGNLYVMGGSDGQRSLAANDVYYLDKDEWKKLPDLTVARSGFALIYDDSALVAIGGDTPGSAAILERFAMDTDEWTNSPSPMSGGWRHLAATSANGRLYVMGGWNGDYLNVNLEYQSSYRLLLPVISKDK